MSSVRFPALVVAALVASTLFGCQARPKEARVQGFGDPPIEKSEAQKPRGRFVETKDYRVAGLHEPSGSVDFLIEAVRDDEHVSMDLEVHNGSREKVPVLPLTPGYIFIEFRDIAGESEFMGSMHDYPMLDIDEMVHLWPGNSLHATFEYPLDIFLSDPVEVRALYDMNYRLDGGGLERVEFGSEWVQIR